MRERNINHIKQPPQNGNSFLHFEVLVIPNKSQQPPIITKNNITAIDFFRYALEKQKILAFIAALCSLGSGILIPTFSSETANATQVIQSSLVGGIFVQFLNEIGLKFLYFGMIMLVLLIFSNILWFLVAQKQGAAIRKAYFKALLAQEIPYYDINSPTSILATFSSDLEAIQSAIANKIGVLCQIIGCVVATLIYIFTTAWLLSLVCLAILPLTIITGYLYLKSYEGRNDQYKKIYRKAGELSQQAFYAIKTVKQMNSQERQAKKYRQELQNISGKQVKINAKIGISIGLMNFCFFGLCALIYWFGSQCMIEGSSICPRSFSNQQYTPRIVCQVYYLVMNCYYLVVVLSPTVASLKAGVQSAEKVFGVIDRVPAIKKQETGIILQDFKGNIKFVNVSFSYPQNKSKSIINNLTLQLKVGNNVVLGESGCGKTTLIQLILRIYDPDEGIILIDGYNLRSLNLSWFRSQIGFVQQQPLLFAGSVEDNLRLYCPHATTHQIDQVLQQAQAYDFIKQQRFGLKTEVGMRGQQLSGGQKQRIALARALLRKPTIMLFDEFTSALDQQNERRILRNLASLPYKMNIVSVTHRVEVMKVSDYAVILDHGSILQEGKFTQLTFFNELYMMPSVTNIKKMLSSISITQTLKKKESKILSEKEINEYLNNSQENVKIAELEAFQMFLNDQPQIKQNNPQISHQLAILQFIKNSPNNKQEPQVNIWELLYKLFSFNADKKYLLGLALFFSILLGFVIPSTSYIFSKIYASLFKISIVVAFQEGIDLRESSLLTFICLSIGYFLLSFLQILTSFVFGSETTKNIRSKVYDKLLKLPVSWFQRRENNPGVLAEKLGQGCEVITQLVSVLVFVFTVMITGIASCYAIGFIFNWQITLIGLGFLPFILISAFLKSYYNNKITKVRQSIRHESNIILNESLIAIKTITSLSVQKVLYERYSVIEDRLYDQVLELGIKMGFVSALGYFLNFAVLGTLFYFTGKLLQLTDYSVDFQAALIALFQCTNVTQLINSNYHFLPNINQAKQIAVTVLKYLQEQDQDMMQKRQQSQLLKEGINEGRIQFRNVSFSYQTREDKLFNKLNFVLKPKRKVSIVGRSGCGKSTIINLIQRFYNPSQGQIFIDGINIKDFDVHYLRSKLGVVSQQPILLNDTIRETVRYSCPQANEEQVIAACEKANALRFILIGLEQDQQENIYRVVQVKQDQIENTIELTEIKKTDGKGFDKMVGFNGSRLSGGQKQRIAIARMLIKQPTIFLFDQVTSALDIQNETLIQSLLKIISKKKSTLNISHKLQSLKDTDEIILMDRGVIVERGTYQELCSKEGYFSALHKGKSCKKLPS